MLSDGVSTRSGCSAVLGPVAETVTEHDIAEYPTTLKEATFDSSDALLVYIKIFASNAIALGDQEFHSAARTKIVDAIKKADALDAALEILYVAQRPWGQFSSRRRHQQKNPRCNPEGRWNPGRAGGISQVSSMKDYRTS